MDEHHVREIVREELAKASRAAVATTAPFPDYGDSDHSELDYNGPKSNNPFIKSDER